MASVNGRFLTSSSQLLLYIVAVVVALVALFSFALSFNALAELAVASHIPRVIAWAWPVVVDLSIIVGTFASLVLRGRSSRSVRAYPWAILVFFGIVSILGNGYHALTGGAAPTPPVAFAVGAVPAVALLASTHLLVVMLTSPAAHVTDDEIVREVKKAARVRPAPVTKPVLAKVAPARRPAVKLPAPAMEAVTPSAEVSEPAVVVAVETVKPPVAAEPKPVTRAAQGRPGSMTRVQAEKRVLRQWNDTGEWMSGPAVGELMGVSRKTGARVVAGVRDSAAGQTE